MFFFHFQNKSYIPQLFTRKFSPREPKCRNGVVVGDQSINQSINQLILFKDGTISNTASAFALPRGHLENCTSKLENNFRIKF